MFCFASLILVKSLDRNALALELAGVTALEKTSLTGWAGSSHFHFFSFIQKMGKKKAK